MAKEENVSCLSGATMLEEFGVILSSLVVCAIDKDLKRLISETLFCAVICGFFHSDARILPILRLPPSLRGDQK